MYSLECVFGEGGCDRLGSQPAQPSRPYACSYPGHWRWRGGERHHSHYWGLSCCLRTMLPLLPTSLSLCSGALSISLLPSPALGLPPFSACPLLPFPLALFLHPASVSLCLPASCPSQHLLKPSHLLGCAGLGWWGAGGLWPHTSCLPRPPLGSAVKHSYRAVE